MSLRLLLDIQRVIFIVLIILSGVYLILFLSKEIVYLFLPSDVTPLNLIIESPNKVKPVKNIKNKEIVYDTDDQKKSRKRRRKQPTK